MNLRVPPRPVRRLIIDPLWLPISLILAALFGCAAVVGALAAAVARRRRLLRVSLLALAYLYLDLTLLFGCLYLWLRHPLPSRDGSRWRADHCRLLRSALARLMGAANRLIGFRVAIDPAAPDIPDGKPVILLARHAGPGDSFTLVHLILTLHGRLPRVVLKEALQWDPGLDVILTRLSGCFLPSKSGAGEDSTARIARTAQHLGEDDALLIFPEGGNWTPRRHHRAVRRLLRKGEHRAARAARRRPRVLPPRPGGTVAALAARPDADVVVVAHAGLDTLVNPAQIWRAIPLDQTPMQLTWWWYDAAAVPRQPDEAEQWLHERWTDVHAWVDGVASEPLGATAP